MSMGNKTSFDSGGVVVLLITSWGNNDLINDHPGGMTTI